MAELATLARPYAEALFQVATKGDLNAARAEVDELAAVAGNAQLRQFADAPKASAAQVFDLLAMIDIEHAALTAPDAQTIAINLRVESTLELAVRIFVDEDGKGNSAELRPVGTSSARFDGRILTVIVTRFVPNFVPAIVIVIVIARRRSSPFWRHGPGL